MVAQGDLGRGLMILFVQNRSRSEVTSDQIIDLIYPSIAQLDRFYPQFSTWFCSKAVASNGAEERAFFVSRNGKKLGGVAIAKRSPYERKLCTLWVAPERRTSGVASDLAEQAFLWLGTQRPLFTVPEEVMGDFSSLLNAWRFDQYRLLNGYYRSGMREFVFNGPLLEPARSSPEVALGTLPSFRMESHEISRP